MDRVYVDTKATPLLTFFFSTLTTPFALDGGSLSLLMCAGLPDTSLFGSSNGCGGEFER